MALDKQKMEIKIVDAKTEEKTISSSLCKIRNFLHDLSCNYPYFEEWLEQVFLDINTHERIIVVCELDEQIIGLAILKDTPLEKKICTIRVAEAYRRQRIGTMLMIKSREILKDDYPLITVSDEHINIFRIFLSRFGFKEISKVKSVYRYGHDEYYFNKPYVHHCVLMSIKPQYAQRILSGEKTVEFRKKCFNSQINKVYIYSSSPIKKIVGYFEVENLYTDSPQNIWHKFSIRGRISESDFRKYYGDKSKGYVICIDRCSRLRHEVNIDNIFDAKTRPPQNFMYIDNVVTLRRLRLLE